MELHRTFGQIEIESDDLGCRTGSKRARDVELALDYKNVALLQRLVTRAGRLRSRRATRPPPTRGTA